ncbi:MAG: Uncharacterised protein [Cyanobium sp. ARS6]|nr:MAG: Uncharacterised protein [Cyanobium sp. ARS6]
MASINLEKILFQLTCIGQIAIVNKSDPIGSIDIKRLNLIFSCRCTSRGIANMTYTNIPEQFAHITRSECFTHPPTLFVNMECVIIHRDDSCRVLTTMLKQKEVVINLLINRINRKNTDNSTHDYTPPMRLLNKLNMP